MAKKRKPKTKAKAKAKVRTKPKAKTKAKPKPKAKAKARTKTKAKPKAKAGTKTKAKLKAKARTKPKAKPKAKKARKRNPTRSRADEGSEARAEAERIAEARIHVTEGCLIAADVDKTILAQTDLTEEERRLFLGGLAPHLLNSARLGMKLALVTGNSMPKLTGRFLRFLLEQLCLNGEVDLLSQFHFFCNSGGVYFHFPSHKINFSSRSTNKGKLDADRVFKALTKLDKDRNSVVRPEFVDSNYLVKTHIPPDDVGRISKVLEDCGKEYLTKLNKSQNKIAIRYDLSSVKEKRKLKPPTVEKRLVSFIDHSKTKSVTAQLTLKPVLSFRNGKTEKIRAKLFQNDLRTRVIADIQSRLDAEGLSRYMARPGGATSIDVTLEKLDKAYAMDFLIDRLNLLGVTRQEQRYGSNAIYFGDEVIAGGGNDYAVTRIPGLLVFAVNPEKELIPFMSQVLVPSWILEGPDATERILADLNSIAKDELNMSHRSNMGANTTKPRLSAIEVFKITQFGRRIRETIRELESANNLTPDEWQNLHALVAIMCRDSDADRGWGALLAEQLDSIMTKLSKSAGSASHAQ